ncbi:hypothetical protein [Rhodococcus triatomae]
MSRSPIRRVVAAAAAGALVLGGATVSLGLGAGAAGAQEAQTCSQTSQAVKGPTLETIGATHTYDRSVNTVETTAGQQVTYKTVVSSKGGLPVVTSIKEVPPTGFAAPVSARLTYNGGAAGPIQALPDGNGYKISASALGWLVTSGKPLTLETTYVVPETVTPGSTVTDAGIKVGGTVGIDNDLPDLTSCFSIRLPNVGEAVLSVADATGLGSEEGQLSSTGSVSDILGDALVDVIESGALEGIIS